MTTNPNNTTSAHIDVAIIGGGIAGCWLLKLLSQKGYRVALFEAEHLGCDQTLAAQGMIHGGLKYALAGALTGESEAIASMPGRWRACLNGEDPMDLRGVRLLTDNYQMFAKGSALGRLTTFFASKALRGRVNKLNRTNWPSGFNGFDGVVYGLNDFVLDIPSLLENLVAGLEHRTFNLTVEPHMVRPTDSGYSIHTEHVQLEVDTLICCAGNGSAPLLTAVGMPQIRTQQRPLKQVIVRPRHKQQLFAHCVTGVTSNEPRLTITSHLPNQESNHEKNGSMTEDPIWYLGGGLATSGVSRSDNEQIDFAAKELRTCVPWLDWDGADFETFYVERAEPYQVGGLKPDEAYVAKQGNFIQCFPTKLTLAPDLGDKLLAQLAPPAITRTDIDPSTCPASIGSLPW